ncbi:ABC transporter permease [Microbacterium sediminicola]|uniref:ABC transporter permease n=1 Tax=Microbacterium sediminicola TaxID=415210 RepID=A0ABN2IA44_9MICO
MTVATATRAEFTKQFSTSMWWLLTIILVAYVAFTAGALAFVFGGVDAGVLPGQGAPVPTEGIAPVLYGLAATVGYVVPLIVGTLMVTGEFRHQTLTATFLTTPRRSTVLWAKIVAGAIIGVGFGIVGTLAAALPSAGILAAFGLPTDLDSRETWALLARVVLAFAIWVLVGIGVGALVRNQVAAVVGVLVFTQFLEPIARTAGAFVDGLDAVTAYLPGAASDALVGSSVFALAGGAAESGLEWWAGGLVLTAYAVVFLVLGYATSWRRDVS